MKTYGRLELEENRWRLLQVVPHVALRLKNMFQRIDKNQTINFSLPASDDMSADLEWFFERYAFDMDKPVARELHKRAKRYREDRDAIEAISLPGWRPEQVQVGWRDGYALRLHQAQAFELFVRRRNLLVGDDVGLGKSFVGMAACIASAQRGKRTAVVVQAQLGEQWADEFLVPATKLRVHIIAGTLPYDLPDADVYIFRYSNISGWSEIVARGVFETAIFDEIQELRTGAGTAKGGACMVLAQNTSYRLGLSATPIYNLGSEIWHILSYIDPDVLGGWEDFTREWCTYEGNDKYAVKDPDALGAYMRESMVFIRRLREGRPVDKQVVEVDYDEKIAGDSYELARRLAIKVLDGDFSESGQASRQLDALARRITGEAKAPFVAAYVRMLLDAGEAVLLAGWHRAVYDKWMELLADYEPLLFTGSETAAHKNKNKRLFMSGKHKLLIISNRSGVGVDGFQNICSTVVHGELDWTPSLYEQLLGRIDREGQKKQLLTQVFLYANYGSDPTVMRVNAIKADQSRGIFDPGREMPEQHVDTSHIKMLAEAFLERKRA